MPSSARRRTRCPHVAHAGRVESGRRLVEQEHPRVAEERRGDAEPLAHPVRVAADLVLRAVAKLDDVEHLVDPAAGAASVVVGEQLQVPSSAHVGVEAGPLDEARDSFQGPRPVDERVAPEQLRRAGGGPDQPEQHPQRGRLAGPVGAEVAEDVAGLDGEVDVVDRDDLTVALDQPARDDGARRSSKLACCRLGGRRRHRSREDVETPPCCQVSDGAELRRELVRR